MVNPHTKNLVGLLGLFEIIVNIIKEFINE